MNIHSIDERLRFIHSLELAEPSSKTMRLKGKPGVSDGDEAGYVDAGALVSFVSGVSAQSKSDTLNSTLLAQLAANKKYNREDQTKEWYDFYRTVLENVGWVVQSFSFERFKASGTSFTVEKVIAEVLAAIATKEDKKIIDATIAAVNALDKGDGRLTLWNDNSTHFDKGNFQISACVEDDGVIVMKLGAFNFKTDERVTGVLWFTFSSSSTEFYKGGQVVNLNLDVYSRVRKQVIDKLGSKAQEFIGDLDI